jgi:U32 family peptidase
VKTGETVPAAKGSGWQVKTALGIADGYTVLAKNL